MWLRTLAEVLDHLGASGQAGTVDGTEIRVRGPAVSRKDRDKFISGKNKQNAVKAMVLTDASGRLLFCSPARPASCADTTHARQSGLAKHLAGGPAVEILADAGGQDLGAQTRRPRRDTTTPQVREGPTGLVRGGLRTPAHGTFLTPVRVEHAIARLKNWRAPARHHGRRDHMSDAIRAIAGLLSHRQTTTRGDRQPQ
ncbi:transposase family protein [Streptomyces sp. NPDC059456]|uniref:transposase family protein n=1 Tax=Streptomyces sp. NPDC059456 TaxID=3346838 RepID=UPI003679682F